MSARDEPAWWPLEGDEPDPRWSLANERTLLAYNRTGLAFLVAGLAVAGSRGVAETSIWFGLLGLPLIALAGGLAWAGRARFLAAQRAMRRGEPLAAPRLATRLPLALVVIAVISLAIGALELAT